MTAVAPAVRDGLTATATLMADRDGGRPRIRWSHAWPVVLRPTGSEQVHLVHGAGGPLGGDVLALDVQVGDGAALRVRSAGATLVQPGRGGRAARWDTTVAVGTGGRLDWAPEPVIVTDGAEFDTSLRVCLGPGGSAVVRETVVLGRHGCAGGSYRGHLAVTLDGEPLLAHTTVLDGADRALCGPGGTAGARAVGSLVLAGRAGPGGAGDEPGVRWAWSDLDGPGAVLMAVGDPGPVTAVLDAAMIVVSGAGATDLSLPQR